MTAQEMLNKVVTHLLTQNAKSMSEDAVGETCLYRDGFGRSCSIGCLLPDEVYKPEMDLPQPNACYPGTGVISLTCRFPEVLPYLTPSDRELNLMMLDDLQSVHDSYPVKMWPEQLRIVAQRYDLHYPA